MSGTTGTAVVFGTTGNVGYGVAQALLQAGYRVVAPTRSPEKAAALPDTFPAEARAAGELHPIVGDTSSRSGAQALYDSVVAAHGPVDHVVAAMGPWWQGGRTIDQSEAEYRQVMQQSLDVHVFAAQAFVAGMKDRPGSSYTIITGQGGHETIPDTSLLVIAVGGQFALSRMLRHEHAGDPIRINELLIAARIERKPRAGVVPSASFGQACRRLMESGEDGTIHTFRRGEPFLGEPVE